MDQRRTRVALDNPVFAGTLRYQNRGAQYVQRPVRAATISDVKAARQTKQPSASTPALQADAVLLPVHSQRLPVRPRQPQLRGTGSVPVPKTAQPTLLPRSKPSTVKADSQDSRTKRSQMANVRFHARPGLSRSTMLYTMACIVFAAGILSSISGFQANRHVAAQVKTVQRTYNTSLQNDDKAPPSTVKPTDQEVRRYAVSPNVPRYIDIPKLAIHARTLSEGVDRKNELQVPWNIYDTGWYNASSQPGQNGAMLVDGHSGVGKMRGVFYRLATLMPGDPIIVTRGDGQKFTYIVSKTQTVDISKVDMAGMLVSVETAKPGLNLITCAGDQIPGTTELNKRVQVYAVLR